MDKEELDQLPSHPEHGPASRWEHLRVDGAVARPLTLTAADLAGLRKAEIVEDFPCEQGWVVRSLEWEGVPVGDVLSAAGLLGEARYVSFSAGNFSVALTLEEAQADNALLAMRLNGRPLPSDHGGPCRLVVPGTDCFASIKWLDHMEVTAERPAETAREIALTRIGKLNPPDKA